MTLVITDGAMPLTVLWSELKTGTPAEAQTDLEVVRAYLGMNQLIGGGADDAHR